MNRVLPLPFWWFFGSGACKVYLVVQTRVEIILTFKTCWVFCLQLQINLFYQQIILFYFFNLDAGHVYTTQGVNGSIAYNDLHSRGRCNYPCMLDFEDGRHFMKALKLIFLMQVQQFLISSLSHPKVDFKFPFSNWLRHKQWSRLWVKKHQLPGCILLFGRNDRIEYKKYGNIIIAIPEKQQQWSSMNYQKAHH